MIYDTEEKIYGTEEENKIMIGILHNKIRLFKWLTVYFTLRGK